MLERGEPVAAMPQGIPDPRTAAELEALRATCWRQQQEIRALSETLAILRGGANRLAAETTALRHALAAARHTRGFRGRERSRSRCLRTD